jgi:hypothetical protein
MNCCPPPYLEPHWSLHRVNISDMYGEQVCIRLISLKAALRPFEICRVGQPSIVKHVQIRLGLIWNSER